MAENDENKGIDAMLQQIKNRVAAKLAHRHGLKETPTPAENKSAAPNYDDVKDPVFRELLENWDKTRHYDYQTAQPFAALYAFIDDWVAQHPH